MMSTNTVVLLIALIAAIAQSPDPVQDENATRPVERILSTSPHTRWSVPDAATAVQRAGRVLGPDPIEGFVTETQLVEISNDDTAFLKDQVSGRPLWRVVLDDWSPELTSQPGSRHLYRRTFDVYLDPENGKILKIVSRWPAGAPPTRPMPGAEHAEKCLKGVGEEYLGFPEEPPSITFLQALDVVARDGVGNPLKAAQIMGQYVLWSKLEREPRAVWAITLWGIPPIHTPSRGIPARARDHIRNIVDAKTGQGIIAGNMPGPEPRRKKSPTPGG